MEGTTQAVGSSPLARGTPRERGRGDPGHGIIPACAGNTRPGRDSRPVPRDHPRLRGEHLKPSENYGPVEGSSPLARGTPVCVDLFDGCEGIIPACAGITESTLTWLGATGDHPRLRGEHAASDRRHQEREGSSPLARGTPGGIRTLGDHTGIIPACAGNTPRPRPTSPGSRDHPRLRGEHDTAGPATSPSGGSSPLARGTPPILGERVVAVGIIPACAGNTPTRCSACAWCRDHPRLRGEHMLAAVLAAWWLGSSPLARGTRRVHPRRGRACGIIPACAGNTPGCHTSASGSRDHPRLRGEHTFIWYPHYDGTGSSPLARGTRDLRVAGEGAAGIIPACAGNTSRSAPSCRGTRDHPRLRGEHGSSGGSEAAVAGSSPLARGTLPSGSEMNDDPGIIPACAGNTLQPSNARRRGWDHPRLRGEHTA